MKTFERLSDWVSLRQELKQHNRTIGFVPTMGALHEGHISLVNQAKKENDFTFVSIFVNPTQFNSKEDLEKYPRSITEDISLLNAAGVDAILLPNENEIYEDNFRFKITENKFSKILCGAYRPDHFDGVLTVVMKLLGIAQADRCYMGEKDFQQYLLIKDMRESFFLKTKIISCPTIRESSGLAMSSRNERLSTENKVKAAIIYKYLHEKKTVADVRQSLEDSGFKVEYVEEIYGRRFVAAWLENVRLIDNVKI
ncbi:MAG: pantoate--beta-alanine ligase [Bdellovibrionales bacterium RBG_16_40_8]|nr:MAG: pantoate--beta-alanine ligase [Bdellovibrionales bacterium RBG_16_40_8]